METQGLDAIILAAAGLNRLGLAHLPRGWLSAEEMLPAIGQGALALEVRRADERMRDLVGALDHPPSRVAVEAERAFLERLEGGCLVPVAALGQLAGDEVVLEALIGDLSGAVILRDRLAGPRDRAAEVGRHLAESLLKRGGREILSEIYCRPL
jgi:hydroxymethylbilane synthase